MLHQIIVWYVCVVLLVQAVCLLLYNACNHIQFIFLLACVLSWHCMLHVLKLMSHLVNFIYQYMYWVDTVYWYLSQKLIHSSFIIANRPSWHSVGGRHRASLVEFIHLSSILSVHRVGIAYCLPITLMQCYAFDCYMLSMHRLFVCLCFYSRLLSTYSFVVNWYETNSCCYLHTSTKCTDVHDVWMCIDTYTC